jgi:hypothetical protein
VFVLIDGTNCVLPNKTNIQKINSFSEAAGFEKYYQAGIGAFSRTKLIDILIAPDLEPRALEVFQTIQSLGLKSEDRLYIFGYSRGAVIARVLAMCIASHKHLYSAARISGFTGSIQAQIELLCLFDPVIGRPRIHNLTVPNHDAILEPRVKNYLELLSVEESKFIYPSDSYSSSKATLKRVSSISSTSKADTTADRQQAMTELGIRKTRKAIWFPGTHSDVGGNGSNKVVGLHTLLTAVREFELISQTSGLGVTFPKEEVKKILDQINAFKEIKETNSKGWWPRAKRSLSRHLSRRAPHARGLVQHFGHPSCGLYAGSAAVLEVLPEYPV